MNWRQLLSRLDNSTLKWFNRKVSEAAQEEVIRYAFRCTQCEDYAYSETTDQLSACKLIREKGWGCIDSSKFAGYISLSWFCPKCWDWMLR